MPAKTPSRCFELGPKVGGVIDLPLCDERPHDEIIGCAPAGENSTIERRRPSANQASASAKTAPSSGPRWAQCRSSPPPRRQPLRARSSAADPRCRRRRTCQRSSCQIIRRLRPRIVYLLRFGSLEQGSVSAHQRRQCRGRHVSGAYAPPGFLS